ncbi:MAG: TIGR02281 family clan AA aspartic protease [Gammaproteobacteria bacterium]|nr:TIGR02281 family clan AA aspartic protease [Gammaproteobacteria bacterium]HXK56208.1 TIGR02281 family clan AA aspartic protease [Gammaproteobacteria bacterium]
MKENCPPRLMLFCAALIAVAVSSAAQAVERIKVMALFPEKAMVEIDGTRRFLRVGEPSPEGVVLKSANARGAVIEVEGRSEQYQLGASYGGNFAATAKREVRIPRNRQGSFVTLGSINGRSTEMLVDTGATSMAMSEVEAKRLGIPYRFNGKRSGVQTASGVANAYQITLAQVQVGEIELKNVDAVVIKGNSPPGVLLGMSFLNRVKMEVEGSVLILSKQP